MSYRAFTAAEVAATLTERELTDAGKAVGLRRIPATAKVVDSFDLRLAVKAGYGG